MQCLPFVYVCVCVSACMITLKKLADGSEPNSQGGLGRGWIS